MSRSKNRFQKIWKNQKDIGKLYGKSAIAVGKALVELGLKDEETKEATKIALDEGFAQLTPLKDGTLFYLWNKQKVCEELDLLEDWTRQSQEERELTEFTKDYISWLKQALKADSEGNSKAAKFLYHEARTIAKKIARRNEDFVNKANELLKAAKIDDDYLIEQKQKAQGKRKGARANRQTKSF